MQGTESIVYRYSSAKFRTAHEVEEPSELKARMEIVLPKPCLRRTCRGRRVRDREQVEVGGYRHHHFGQKNFSRLGSGKCSAAD